jgi:hypothetical protein
MSAIELRDFILTRVADGSCFKNKDFPPKFNDYTIKKVIRELMNEGKIVSRITIDGKTRMYFRDDKSALIHMKEHVSSIASICGKIVFSKDADVVHSSGVEVTAEDSSYQKLVDAHVSGSGYRTSL